MKKIISLFAAIAISMSAMAQEHGFSAHKFLDNWYIGVNGGGATGTRHQALLENINWNVGVRLGKLFTPVFGMGIEGNIYFGNKHHGIQMTYNTPINYTQIGIIGTFNLTNAIKGYYGQPRNFEVFAVPGFAWGHNYGDGNYPTGTILNTFVNKLAFDFCYNFGNDKQFQLYLEPSLNYAIAGVDDPERAVDNTQNFIVSYNINNSFLQLNLGFIYKFMTSNNTHNFALVESCDNEEKDRLNEEINKLLAKMDKQDAEIVELERHNETIKDKIDECAPTEELANKKDEPDLPTVFYQVNKAVITPAQAQNVAIAAEVLKNHPEYKLLVKGYASPDGGHDNNNSLGVKRANAVKDMLVKKYRINPDRITAEGCGETDELFPIYEFNRVAMMILVKE